MSHQGIPDLLHDGLDVLIYAGDVDYICNWLGNKKWVKALEWDGKEEFNLAEDKPWNLTKGKFGPIWPYLALQGIYQH